MAVLGSGSPQYFVIVPIWPQSKVAFQFLKSPESCPRTLFAGMMTVAATEAHLTYARSAGQLSLPTHLPLVPRPRDAALSYRSHSKSSMSPFQIHLARSGRSQTPGSLARMPPPHQWRQRQNRILSKWLFCRTFSRKREEEITINVFFNTVQRDIIVSAVGRGSSAKFCPLQLHYYHVKDCWKFWFCFKAKLGQMKTSASDVTS